MKFRPKKKSPIGKSGKGAKGVKPDSLKIVLNHGDLLVMHGTDIHKYYEVSRLWNIEIETMVANACDSMRLIRTAICALP